jgi:diadenosine tetraphosphate (Ap4A) HIT family hydrolase
MTSNCFFCRMLKNDTKKEILLQNDLAVMIRDTRPVSDGHSLIIPRRHVSSFFDTSTEERIALMELLDQTKEDLARELSPDDYNIGINDGPLAGQSIPHVHIHLIPRYKGDKDDPRGGVRWIISEKAKYW